MSCDFCFFFKKKKTKRKSFINMPSCTNTIIGNWCNKRATLWATMRGRPYTPGTGHDESLDSVPPRWAVLGRLLRYLCDPFASGFLLARHYLSCNRSCVLNISGNHEISKKKKTHTHTTAVVFIICADNCCASHCASYTSTCHDHFCHNTHTLTRQHQSPLA